MEGTIDYFGDTQWVIGGHTVLVDGQTEIEGTPEEGLQADADGIVLLNGDLLAQKIEVEEAEEGEEPPDGGGPPEPGVTKLLLTPSEVEVFTGDSFSVIIKVTGVDTPGLAAYDIGITFNPSVIQIDSVVGVNADFGEPLAVNIDNTAGEVNFADVITDLEGPTGSISLVKINGTAVSEEAASTSLEFSKTDLTNPFLDPLPNLEKIEGEVRVLVQGEDKGVEGPTEGGEPPDGENPPEGEEPPECEDPLDGDEPPECENPPEGEEPPHDEEPRRVADEEKPEGEHPLGN